MDLQDDVIEENTPLSSPCSGPDSYNRSRFSTQRVYERSVSHDYAQHPRLKSILKRSKSDSGSCDTDEDFTYSRMRASTLSDDNLYLAPKNDYATRRRHRSVTFLEKPTVFEFTKQSKRQWKRQNKEQKQREAMDNKVKEMLNQHSPSKGKEPKSGGKKLTKSERKKNRCNSESKSEEENDIPNVQKKTRSKKKKSKKLNKHLATSSGPDSSGSERVQQPGKVSFNNTLIYELD